MKAQSKDYVTLQNLYRSQAAKEHAIVIAEVRKMEKEWNRPTPIDEKDIITFCKNSRHMQLIEGRDILSPEQSWTEITNQLKENQTATLIYLAFLAFENGYSDLDHYLNKTVLTKEERDNISIEASKVYQEL